MRNSLRARVIAFAVALALIPLLIVSAALLGISYNANRVEALDRQRTIARQLADQTDATIGEIQQALDVVARTSNWEALDTGERGSLVETLYDYRTPASAGSGVGIFDEVLLLDTDGQFIAGQSATEQTSFDRMAQKARSEALQLTIKGESYQGPVYVSSELVPRLDLAVPTRDLAGGITGLLWGSINLDEALWPIVAAEDLAEGTQIYVFDSLGYLVAGNGEHLVQRSEALTGLVPVDERAGSGILQGSKVYQGLAGKRVVGAWQPVEELGWTLVIETPTQQAMAGAQRLLIPAMIVSLATLGIAAGVAFFVTRTLTQRLENLRAGAEIIGTGNLDYRIPLQSPDELGSLAQTFNRLAINLRASQEALEEQTQGMATTSEQMRHRAVQLQTSAEVARAIASVRELDRLLPQIAQLISERFGWYHVGIFLTDETGKYAVLRAANSPGGQQMLARRHRLEVGEKGIVGYVTDTGQPRIALDVGQDAVYFDTPELSGTRSEMALPLKVGDQIIGALDVQSKAPSAFDEEDVAMLGTLADQVAIAIENTRQFEQTQKALAEVEALHRQYVQSEWAQTITGQRGMTYEYRRAGLPALASSSSPELAVALTEGRIVTAPDRTDASAWGSEEDEYSRAVLAAPIKLRDQVIGALDLEEVDGSRLWSEDEIALVQAISDQVALALENARLFADTQRRAEQLATLHRVGLDVTSALDLTGVLQALYEQVQRIMDVGSFYVALFDKTTGTIEFPLLTGVDGFVQVEPLHIRDQAGITGHVIQSGQPLYVPDLHLVHEEESYDAVAVSDRETRSYLGVPLIFREDVLGVLSIQSYKPNAYSESDVELLVTLATQASIAIQNARAYERLVETAEELREVDRLKTQFLANMSHELRTPLNSIIGFSRVMLKGIDGPLTDLQETDLTSIYNSGQHLLSLINSILDMSKIQAGKMDLSFDEIALPEVFDAILSTTSALIKDQPIELKSIVPGDLPTVWADAQRVRQVLINLMSNAAKFTEEGQILLKAEAGREFVTISVSDTGVGIEPEAQKRLFIPFQQVDASTTRRAGGTGLGLAISRSFVEIHGGEIWVESEPGQGSTFFFTLPIYQVVQARGESDAEIELDPNRKLVLTIDDDGGVHTLMQRYLENDGYQVIGVMESPLALETARRLAPNLAAVTLDVVMPHMDGWQVLRALKEDPQTEHIPVILCSVAEGVEQGLSLGAAACLKKPVTRDEVLDTLKKVENHA